MNKVLWTIVLGLAFMLFVMNRTQANIINAMHEQNKVLMSHEKDIQALRIHQMPTITPIPNSDRQNENPDIRDF